jgi:mRNA-degrading endonuclease RelE of RelBE toxin-antitoxin system
MNCKIIVIDEFKKDVKKLLKKYHSLKDELIHLQEQLLENPRMGALIYKNTYKIRVAVKSKGKGKSGGLRLITYIVEIQIEESKNEQNIVIFLAAIYDKYEMENISNHNLRKIISEINNELDNEETK